MAQVQTFIRSIILSFGWCTDFHAMVIFASVDSLAWLLSYLTWFVFWGLCFPNDQLYTKCHTVGNYSKIRKFHQISCYGNFVERNSFRRVSGDSHSNQMAGFYVKCDTRLKWVKREMKKKKKKKTGSGFFDCSKTKEKFVKDSVPSLFWHYVSPKWKNGNNVHGFHRRCLFSRLSNKYLF